jgi:hypothetical protein
MIVKGLPAGKHDFQFRVGAANSEPDGGQVVSLTVNVKDAWPWAVATLVFAGLLSYFVTKGVENQRERVKLHSRIRGLQKDWLAALPPVEPIAWLGAVQRQSLDLLQQATLGLVPAPREIAQQLDKAERLLGLLRIYRELRTGLRSSRLDRLERSRFLAELDGTIRTIEPELLEEAGQRDQGASGEVAVDVDRPHRARSAVRPCQGRPHSLRNPAGKARRG